MEGGRKHPSPVLHQPKKPGANRVNSLVLTWERNFEVTFGVSSVLLFQISILESYLDIYLF